jgi:aminoglycoside 3-N-acetyltransferase
MTAQPESRPPAVTVPDVVAGLKAIGAEGRPLCVHASVRSFGHLEDGPRTILEAARELEITLLVPTSTFQMCLVAPPTGQVRPFNAIDHDNLPTPGTVESQAFTTEATFVGAAMGGLPRAVLCEPGHVRGNHPLASFTALGPLAEVLTTGQAPLDVFAPLRELAARDGVVAGFGVGLEAITMLHLAERRAGLRLLRRWGKTPDGVVESEHGGCSRGFERLAPALAPVERHTVVGSSSWRAWPAVDLLDRATEAFARDPSAGRCDDAACGPCRDLVAAAEAGYRYPDQLFTWRTEHP